MDSLLWKIIEESKSGKEYLNSKEQFENLIRILSRYDKDTILELEETWRTKTNQLMNDEFELLHGEDGGIVWTGDDGFYMDFANWVIAQGEQLFERFQNEGHVAVLDYIEKHNIPDTDYTFECMIYVFQDVLE